MKRLDLDDEVAPVPHLFRGGTFQARAQLKRFISDSFAHYDENRGRPETDHVSYMSMYLHYGQISPVYVALEVANSGGSEAAIEAYHEELIVRRELERGKTHDRYWNAAMAELRGTECYIARDPNLEGRLRRLSVADASFFGEAYCCSLPSQGTRRTP